MELIEILFPEPRCEGSPNHAHFFTQVTSSIWRCRHCWHSKWLPNSWEECDAFGNSIRRFGLDGAYKYHLRNKPMIRQILRKLEEIRLLRKVLPEKQLMMAVAAILTNKEENFCREEVTK